jgi:hypothetical protein
MFTDPYENPIIPTPAKLSKFGAVMGAISSSFTLMLDTFFYAFGDRDAQCKTKTP